MHGRKVTWRVLHLCGHQQHKTVELEKDAENTKKKIRFCVPPFEFAA